PRTGPAARGGAAHRRGVRRQEGGAAGPALAPEPPARRGSGAAFPSAPGAPDAHRYRDRAVRPRSPAGGTALRGKGSPPAPVSPADRRRGTPDRRREAGAPAASPPAAVPSAVVSALRPSFRTAARSEERRVGKEGDGRVTHSRPDEGRKQ